MRNPSFKILSKAVLFFMASLVSFVVAGCADTSREKLVDTLNEQSYAMHYRNLGLTRRYALQALAKSNGYGTGIAESYNNLAFVCLARMNYGKAEEFLRYASSVSDNLVEQLVAEIQLMRLCQRRSSNKSFYSHMQVAHQLMTRIAADETSLDDHQHRRYVYACSEYSIVASTYYYYVGLERKGAEQLAQIDPNGEVVKDTAQLLNYYYNIGSGGILRGMSVEEICQEEFNYLMRCYLLSRQYGYPYWEANSLQALSEHLMNGQMRDILLRDNVQEMEFVNVDKMPPTLVAGNLATRSLKLFQAYGDVYQTAGAYRTLAQCYFDVDDFQSALICLDNALNSNARIGYAPALVASLREKLSMVYSALDNKPKSDYNRNIYLDLQDFTRQDRMLEARAEQLDHSSAQLSMMIGAIGLVVFVLVALLVRLNRLRKSGQTRGLPKQVIDPLLRWNEIREAEQHAFSESMEEIDEQTAVARQQLADNKVLNIEQRAKISLAMNIMPLIDRIAVEVNKLYDSKSMSENLAEARYKYVRELAEKINEYNNALTRWIKLRRGDLTVKVESFALQQLFDIISGSRMEYNMKGVSFDVVPTDAVVKADRTLTLFMLNTLADNARQHTPKGGRVAVTASEHEDFVEVSVTDTGEGMAKEQLDGLFSAKVIVDEELHTTASVNSKLMQKSSHGFGLLNCKGIMEKYKKLSSKFSVCDIGAESALGEGSRFFFRLPKGVARSLLVTVLIVTGFGTLNAATVADSCLVRAGEFADSAYFSNVSGHYERTLAFADSCLHWLNYHYKTMRPHGKLFLTGGGNPKEAAELKWYYDSVPCNYSVILDIRNETAVAALALHKWDVYNYNNKVYTQLFRDVSADNSLSQYVKVMQKSETNKNVAVILLVVLLVSIVPLYYFFYYRYRLRYRNALESVVAIGKVLVGDGTAFEKHASIISLWEKSGRVADGDSQTARLADLVRQICETLERDRQGEDNSSRQMSFARDELQRLEYERDRLHVSNSVLDNCLSTLKHETMYYPCRIMQLVDAPVRDVTALKDVVCYYRELFSILCEQANSQAYLGSRLDCSLVQYVIGLLRKAVPSERLQFSVCDRKDGYVAVSTCMESLRLSRQQVAELFTPSTVDFRFLVCRQIIRDFGELTNSRGCGIQAMTTADGCTNIEITITQKIWKNSK